MTESKHPHGATGEPLDGQMYIVLLVDDQAMIAEAVRRMLADQPDLHLHYCGDPAEAVAVAKAVKPTVILQDLVMPGITGLTLVKHYRGDPVTKDIPVIVLSTKEEPAVKSEAFAIGASDYLVKLPDRIELVARIRLHSRARVNQLQRDAAYLALRESQQQLMLNNTELVSLNQKLEEATEALRVEAMHDSLSGLLNRRAFFELFQRELTRAARQDSPLSVIMADIDHFKTINDQHGHLAGDVVIREVSRRLRASIRISDIVARYGGEEFVVVAPDCGVSDATDLAERFRLSICTLPFEIPGGCISTSMSLGIVTAEGGGHAEDLLSASDAALYRAKRDGRNRIALHGAPGAEANSVSCYQSAASSGAEP